MGDPPNDPPPSRWQTLIRAAEDVDITGISPLVLAVLGGVGLGVRWFWRRLGWVGRRLRGVVRRRRVDATGRGRRP